MHLPVWRTRKSPLPLIVYVYHALLLVTKRVLVGPGKEKSVLERSDGHLIAVVECRKPVWQRNFGMVVVDTKGPRNGRS